jgi:hypothetical protein
MKRWVLRKIWKYFPNWIREKSQGDPNATWLRKELHRAPNNLIGGMAFQFIGQRSDNTHFFVTHVEPMESLLHAKFNIQEGIERNLEASLDDYLHCACQVKKPCLYHQVQGEY